MNGKVIIKKPNICVAVLKINGKAQQLGAFNTSKEIELPYGTYKINVGLEISDTGHIGMDHGHSHWSDVEWAWKEDKELIVDEKTSIIKIKRKWHLLKHITTEAIIKKEK